MIYKQCLIFHFDIFHFHESYAKLNFCINVFVVDLAYNLNINDQLYVDQYSKKTAIFLESKRIGNAFIMNMFENSIPTQTYKKLIALLDKKKIYCL